MRAGQLTELGVEAGRNLGRLKQRSVDGEARMDALFEAAAGRCEDGDVRWWVARCNGAGHGLAACSAGTET